MPVQMPDINLVTMLPEILIAILGLVLLLMSAGQDAERGRKVNAMALAGVIAAAALTVVTANGSSFGGFFVVDPFARAMKLLMLLATGMVLYMSMEYMRDQKFDGGEYQVMTLMALLGGMIMASAGDFVVLYMGLELMSLSIYVLAAWRRDDVRSNEAGLKYFVLGSMASGFLLYGISLIYGTTGTTLFTGVATALSHGHISTATIMGVVMVLAGMSFKVAAAPFHMWAPDVYEGAPTSVTAFMAVLPKIAAFAAIFRVLLIAFPALQSHWNPLLQLLAVASLAVGAIAAIGQTNIKRMLAYSSIGHVGFILLGLTAHTGLGYQSVVAYLAIYIFMSVGAFAIILLLNKAGVGDEIEDYKGLGHKRPMLALLMALFMFSMAGIPPLAGFMGKLYVFMAAVQSGMMMLAVAGVLFSAIGAFYYLRIVKFMYFDQPAEGAFGMELDFSARAILTVTGVVMLVWGLFPGALLSWSGASVKMFQ
ncbi:MAG: NADH-quinone oxidoreductase subunit NuoN [Magnetococcales bacterium]|nr:NADH-quinone oxidoreductase subunit NuoN [Magnetococcales bacterium]NGZ06005.1 NADH-quinone oxidoreductase subunit NuoN [Magnetococcales bacterium]